MNLKNPPCPEMQSLDKTYDFPLGNNLSYSDRPAEVTCASSVTLTRYPSCFSRQLSTRIYWVTTTCQAQRPSSGRQQPLPSKSTDETPKLIEALKQCGKSMLRSQTAHEWGLPRKSFKENFWTPYRVLGVCVCWKWTILGKGTKCPKFWRC